MFKKLFLALWVGCCSGGALPAQNKADSIIAEVLKSRDLYGEYIREYEAQVYIKGNTQVIKKNLLARYAPDFLYWDQKNDNSFVEAIVDVHYTAPNYFTQQIKAVNGDQITVNDIQDRVMQFLNINIYNPTIINDQVILPGINNVFDYYRFQYIAAIDTLDHKIHQIRIHPKIRSQKLIAGDFYIVDGAWTVFRVSLRGKWELFDFRIETEFGLNRRNFLLPVNSAVTFHLNLLGNETENRYFSRFEYQSVRLSDWSSRDSQPHYDLSNYFNIRTDSIPFTHDSTFWAERRPVPLSAYEQSLWDKRKKTQKEADSIVLSRKSWNFSKGLVIPTTFEYNDTKFTYSGLTNPLKLAYSKLDGILYWQQFKIHRHFSSGQVFRFQPNLGILFQRKQAYFNTPVFWLFAPAKFGEINFNFGNRNQSYNSGIINQINWATPDSIHFSDFNLEYYKHFQTDLEAKYELTNGLLIYGGIHYDWYIPVRNDKNTAPLRGAIPADDLDDSDVIDLVQNRYRTFAPIIGLQWTPGQFYRINGKRKEYLHSRYPTFFIEYARGIRGILQSNSYYERIEMDIQQKIRLGLMRSFHYYVGAGRFTNTQSVYFADFSNFRRQNIPQSWEDPIGGVFHILGNDWYNAANMYAQLHLMYESPFFILQLFRRITTDIVSERIYASQLYTPVLPCYTEIGYGVGNFTGNAGIFVSFHQGRYEAVGVKFAFELGL
ncbi:MAG: DUF5686 family protein [Dysgonamonadaceae bacterium]|jgi:hypothetical protein|nr:DUF5686 family protein [Dysgonamonadaceae bacterium]